MAKKLPAKGAASRKRAAAPAKAGADDLATMHPDVTLTIGDRTITFREYGHIEGLQLRPHMVAFAHDLDALVRGAKSELLFQDIFDVAGLHVPAVQLAMAQSMAEPGKPASQADMDWLASLDGPIGEEVMEAWWIACGPFFLRQVTKRMKERMERKKQSAGQTSTSPSPRPATAHPPSSGDTPSASSSSSTSGAPHGSNVDAPT